MIRILRKIKSYIFDKMRFIKWYLTSKDRSYHNFYIKTIIDNIEDGHPHPTLGKKIKDIEKFKETAKIEKQLLIENGLKTSHLFVDFGCGSLRLGSELISYLNSNKYIGLDMTDYFINMGKESLSKELLKEKNPTFKIINSETISELQTSGVNFLMSAAVLIHIPENELNQYFKNIITLIGKNGKAYVDFVKSDRIVKASQSTWLYPLEYIGQIINKNNAKYRVIELQESQKQFYNLGHTILEITLK